jgi:hypothetical protein
MCADSAAITDRFARDAFSYFFPRSLTAITNDWIVRKNQSANAISRSRCTSDFALSSFRCGATTYTIFLPRYNKCQETESHCGSHYNGIELMKRRESVVSYFAKRDNQQYFRLWWRFCFVVWHNMRCRYENFMSVSSLCIYACGRFFFLMRACVYRFGI